MKFVAQTYAMRFTLIAILLLFLASCSVTKRRFNPGFHVEFRTKIRVNISELETTKIEEKSIFESTENTLNAHQETEKKPTTNSQSDSVYSKLEYEANSTDSQSILSVYNKPTVNQINDSKKAKNTAKYSTKNPEKKHVEVLTWVALGIILLILIGVGILLLVQAFSDFIILLPLFTIPALILSTISLSRVTNDPDNYKHKWLTILVAVLSILAALASIAGFFYVIIHSLLNWF